MIIMYIKSIKNKKYWTQKFDDNLTTLYMVLFQSSFEIFCSTHGSLWQFLAFKDLYIPTNLRNKFLKKFYKTMNFDLHT